MVTKGIDFKALENDNQIRLRAAFTAHGSPRVTSGVEDTMAVQAPTSWRGNEIGRVLPRPVQARGAREVEVTIDADGIPITVQIPYRWEDEYSQDGEKVVGSYPAPQRCYIAGAETNPACIAICKAIDLADQPEIVAAMEAIRAAGRD